MRALLAIGLGLGLWSLAAMWADAATLPGPLAVAAALLEALTSGSLFADLGASLRRVLTGYAVAAILGLSLGALSALSGTLGAALRDIGNTLRPIPPIAWVPLALLWFGLGDPSATFIVFIGSFFPIFSSVSWALSSTPAAYLELSRALGVGPGLRLWRVQLPAAAPAIGAGLRTGLGLAWTSVIAAELVGAQAGLGYRIQLYRLLLQPEGVIACMVTIGLVGLSMDRLLHALLRRLVDWEAA